MQYSHQETVLTTLSKFYREDEVSSCLNSVLFVRSCLSKFYVGAIMELSLSVQLRKKTGLYKFLV